MFVTNISEVRARHKKYWFSKKTMMFFNSVVYNKAYKSNNNNIFFVSSERYNMTPEFPPMFSVRKCNKDGDIDTIGEFQAYRTKQEAYAEAMKETVKDDKKI